MGRKGKREENGSGPVKIDRNLYRIVGREWERLPPSDHWVRFMAVLRRHADNPDICDVRIYDEWCTNNRGITVSDYASLDFHPDLVLFEGWFDKKAGTGNIHLKEMELERVA